MIAGLLKDVTGGVKRSGPFFEDLLHLGGDEVDTYCWTSTPSIVNWMNSQGLTPDQTYMYFVKRAADIVLSYGRNPVHWEEVFNHFGTKLDPRTIIHIWLDHVNISFHFISISHIFL